MNIRTEILKLVKKNDYRINCIQNDLRDCDDIEYDKLVEKLDICRGESKAYNKILSLMEN